MFFITMWKPNGIITLTSDFGNRSYYSGAMKGIILKRFPDARIFDITNSVQPQSIRAGAFIMKQSCPLFPKGSVHIGVVDPGVGTGRLPILIIWNDHIFVGPDNGLFSWIIKDSENFSSFRIEREDVFEKPLSDTFHGRDIFAPVAAEISSGKLNPYEIGGKVEPLKIPFPEPILNDDGTYKCEIFHIDDFGNLLVGFHLRNLKVPQEHIKIIIEWENYKIEGLSRTYLSSKNKSLCAHFDSSGFIEISAPMKNASSLSGLKEGDFVKLKVEKK